MEDDAIREGFLQLKDGSEYDGLYQSALCRSEADWLVGINATRLFSQMYGTKLNIGRVISPTLALVVQRATEIANFVPEPFYMVKLHAGFEAETEKEKDRTIAEADCPGSAARNCKALPICRNLGYTRLRRSCIQGKRPYGAGTWLESL